MKRNILLNPGPSTTTDSVKMAQVVPDICPREKEFGELMNSIVQDLTQVAGGVPNYTTILFGGSGTSVMDAVINSVVPPEKKILVVNNGAYGKRMVEIATAYNIECIELKFSWERLPDIYTIEDALKKDSTIHAICVVHHETTTGLLNPIKEIGELAKNYRKLLIVDAISSFAGIPFNVEECHIDFMMSTSNKCIQGMAGIGFVICRKEELNRIKNYPKRSYYLDLYSQYECFDKYMQMRFTPPVQTIYALRKAIDELLEEGVEQRYIRYTESWQTLRNGLQRLGLTILTNEEDEAHILITVIFPEAPGFDFEFLHDSLYDRGFTIYPGKLRYKNTFRLANMGAINTNDILEFLTTLEKVLANMK